MARGTGLPFPKDDEVIKPAPGINADAYSSAAAWGQIANAGDTIKKLGLDRFEKAKHQAEVGYLAEQETEIKRKQLELHNKYVRDPAGFDREWSAYTQGKLSETEAWAVPQVQKRLGHDGNSAYGALLEEKRRRDEKLDAGRIKALADQAADEVMGMAITGRLHTPEGAASLLKLQAIHASGVNADLMTPEEADLRFQNTTSRAGAEAVVKIIGDGYKTNRDKGLEAGAIAEKMAEDMLLRTQDPRLQGLSERERHHYYGEALSAIRRLEVERRRDLTEAKKSARDTLIAARNGANIPEDVAEEIVGDLTGAGGHADAARFRAGIISEQLLKPFKGLPTSKQIEGYLNLGGALGAGASPSVREAIAEAAEKTGIPRSYLFSRARKESTFNPNARARDSGLDSSAEGLFQFIDSTWAEMLGKYGAKYGLGPDTPKTDARASALMAGEYAKENGEKLKAAGLPVTDATLSLAHFAGPGGAVKMLQANPDALAADVLPEAAAKNRSLFYAKDGGARTVRETIQQVTAGTVGANAPGVDLRMMAGMQKAMGNTAAAEWKTIADAMEKNPGAMPDRARVNSIMHAATLAGDHQLLEQIGRDLDFGMAGQVFGRASVPLQKGALAELRASTTLQPGEVKWMQRMEEIITQTVTKLKEDPIALGVENLELPAPAPLDLSSADAAKKGLAERVGIAKSVGINYGDMTVQALRPADRAQIVEALTGPDVKRAANAFDVLASIPDDNFAATLDSKEIKAAVLGAMKSNDPAKFTAAMMSLDKMWARAPQEFNKLFGDEAVKTVQNWQANLRYHKPEELAEMLRKRDDPAVRKLHKELVDEGHRIVATDKATRMTIASLVEKLDPGWFVSGPDVPMDPRTRDAALADYHSLFAERYAETQRDTTMAGKQAIERMALYWKRSELNGGRLTLHAPETVYGAVKGSHDWMKKEIVADLTALRINQRTLKGSAPADFDMSAAPTPGEFVVVADRITEGDMSSGRPASYIVMMKNKDGTVDTVRGPDHKPLRYWWKKNALTDKAREEFARQRKNVFNQDESYPLSEMLN